MPTGWTSDWEKLFAKCLTDKDYRAQLLSALAADQDTEVIALLNDIGAAGPDDPTLRAGRVGALKGARDPMEALSSQFGAGPTASVAP
jgi:hypothetical protein